ncbi:MAG: hypothetical protein MJ231_01910 [bacterium]|nr:hypothetical protein [bacterium]
MKEDINSLLIKNYTLGTQPYLTSEDRVLEIKNKLKMLDNITSISEAKKITQTFMYFHENVNHIKVGDAKCLIISRDDLFRICFEYKQDFICYNIIKK